MQLSKNFTSEELQCRCCARLLYEDSLIVALQRLRDRFGTPMVVTSGYRCPKHNKEVGGTETSQHTKGTAVDLVFYQAANRNRFIALVEKMLDDGELPEIGGFGWKAYSNGCVHLDVRPRENGRVARW